MSRVELGFETATFSCVGCDRFTAFVDHLGDYWSGQTNLQNGIDPSEVVAVMSTDPTEHQAALVDLFRKVGGCPMASVLNHPVSETASNVQPGDCGQFDQLREASDRAMALYPVSEGEQLTLGRTS